MPSQPNRRATARYALVAAILAVCVSPVLPPSAQNAAHAQGYHRNELKVRSADAPLKIISWDLRDAERAGLIAQPRTVKRVWRNTFGAELRAETKQRIGPGTIDADVVLLQGVKSAKTARKIFPARGWKLILSRQILDLTGFRDRYSKPLPDGKTITAIAVRYSRFVRVTGHEHLMEMSAPQRRTVLPTPVSDGEAANDEASAAKPHPAIRTIARRADEPLSGGGTAATAVRVAHRGHTIWMVTAEFDADCKTSGEECHAQSVLASWINDQRNKGFPVIVGEKTFKDDPRKSVKAAKPAKPGRKAKPVAGPPPPPDCSSQKLIKDPGLDGEPRMEPQSGCMAVVEFKLAPRRIAVPAMDDQG